VLSETRNTKQIKEAAADGYRFHVDGSGGIRWEILTLREVVEGRVNGKPMEIHRSGRRGLTLSLTAAGSRIACFATALREGKDA